MARLTAAAVALAALAAVLAPHPAAGKKFTGKTKDGVEYSYNMNVVPADCRAHSHAPWKCTAGNMWHKQPTTEFEYYYHTMARMTFLDAVGFCDQHGAAVVSITSEAESAFVLSLQENNRHGFWLGLERSNDFTVGRIMSAKSGHRDGFPSTWMDGQPLSFKPWAKGEPNSRRDHRKKDAPWEEQCVFQGINKGHPGIWNDAKCGIMKRVVCKRANTVAAKCAGKRDADTRCHHYYGVPGVASRSGEHDDCTQEVVAEGSTENRQTLLNMKYTELCPRRCMCATTTTTPAPSTTTTEPWTTSTTAVPTSTSTAAPTSTTTEAPTTTTSGQRTTSTSGQRTTSTSGQRTTTTTAEPTSTTTGQTTSTTTEEATTTQYDHGACDTASWQSLSSGTRLDDASYGGIHCCYKYHTSKLPWRKAEATCARYVDRFPVDPNFMVASHLATVTSRDVTRLLKRMRFCKGQEGKFNQCQDISGNGQFNTPDSTWIGGQLADRSCKYNSDTWKCDAVKWVNELYSWYNYKDQFPGRDAWYEDENMDIHEPSLWAPGGRKIEDCIALGSSSKAVVEKNGASRWNDAQCSVRKGYFCEYCLAVRSTTTGPATTTTTAAPTTTTTTAPTTTTTPAPSTTTTTAAPTTTTTTAPTTTTTPAPSTTTTTAAPTTTTTREPQCEDNTCAKLCGEPYFKSTQNTWESKCGWSKTKGICVEGGRTTASELHMGDCGSQSPQASGISTTRTTTTKTQYIPPSIRCEMISCPSDCGIQYGKINEVDGQVPVKPSTKDERYKGQPEEYAAALAAYQKDKQKLMAKVVHECGWSSIDNRCKLGGMTKFSKENNQAINNLRSKVSMDYTSCPTGPTPVTVTVASTAPATKAQTTNAAAKGGQVIAGCIITEGHDYFGNDIGQELGNLDLVQCAQACQAHRKCRAFTLLGGCFLKSSKGTAPAKVDKNAVTGSCEAS